MHLNEILGSAKAERNIIGDIRLRGIHIQMNGTGGNVNAELCKFCVADAISGVLLVVDKNSAAWIADIYVKGFVAHKDYHVCCVGNNMA